VSEEAAKSNPRRRSPSVKRRVVVVGGGAAGLCTAVELLALGADVTVLERESIASGSSGRSVGIVETQYIRPLDIELRVLSMDVFRQLEREHGLDIVRNGYLRLAHGEGQLARFADSAARQHDLGVRDAVVLDRADIARLVPDLQIDDVEGGLFGPSDGYVDGHLYCALLADLVRTRGGVVLQSTPLLDAVAGPGGGHRLDTGAGPLECDAVVVAAGAWAGAIADLLGVDAPTVPQRHQAALALLPETLTYIMPSVMDYTPQSGEYGVYFRHEGPGRLVTGLHTEEAIQEVADPDAYSEEADTAFLELLAEKLAARLPSLADGIRLARAWAGLYPMSADGLPQVGPAPTRDDVVLACGLGGSGLQLSPAIGRLAAEWVVHGEPRSLPAAEALVPSRDSLAEPARWGAREDVPPTADKEVWR
jgi:glycine/D-amino acid oxidase-like deaminating enzyme